MWGVINIPMMAFYAQKSVPELQYDQLDIQLKDPSDSDTADKIVREI